MYGDNHIIFLLRSTDVVVYYINEVSNIEPTCILELLHWLFHISFLI